MPRFVIQIEGEEQTIREIGMFEMERKLKARAVVKKYATAVRKEARARVPVGSKAPGRQYRTSTNPGDLKKSIRAKYYFEGLGAMIFPDSGKGWHRGIVEVGTKDRYTKRSGAHRGKGPAQPFMEPAKRAQETNYNRDMKQIFEDEETTI